MAFCSVLNSLSNQSLTNPNEQKSDEDISETIMTTFLLVFHTLCCLNTCNSIKLKTLFITSVLHEKLIDVKKVYVYF